MSSEKSRRHRKQKSLTRQGALPKRLNRAADNQLAVKCDASSRVEENQQSTALSHSYCPPYDRPKDLPSLIPLWPAEIADTSPENNAMIIRRLNDALRKERQRGRAGHWAYNLNRHRALKRALQAEREAQNNPLNKT